VERLRPLPTRGTGPCEAWSSPTASKAFGPRCKIAATYRPALNTEAKGVSNERLCRIVKPPSGCTEYRRRAASPQRPQQRASMRCFGSWVVPPTLLYMHPFLAPIATRTCREQLATILLPNPVARGVTERHKSVSRTAISQITQYGKGLAGTEQTRANRIWRPVL
jgi:hypothetical protein